MSQILSKGLSPHQQTAKVQTGLRIYGLSEPPPLVLDARGEGMGAGSRGWEGRRISGSI